MHCMMITITDVSSHCYTIVALVLKYIRFCMIVYDVGNFSDLKKTCNQGCGVGVGVPGF